MAGEASTNLTQLACIEETVYGEQETGANLQVIRMTGETLKQDTGIAVSTEIRSDRQTANTVRTSIGASGTINFEFTHATFDDFLAAMLEASAWIVQEVVGPIATISFAAADNSINDSGSGLIGFNVGQWIKISGSALNNGSAKVVSVVAGKVVVSNKTLVIEAAGAQVTLTQGKYIENGVTLKTFNIERSYTEIAGAFVLYTGMAVNTMNLTIPVDGMITGSFGFLGSKEESLAASGGTGYDVATTTKPFATVNDLEAMKEAGITMGFINAGFSLTNNLRARQEAGELGAIGIGQGKFAAEGTLDVYFRDATFFDKYLNHNQTSLALQLENAEGKAYIIEFPAIRLTDGDRTAPGENQDVLGKFKWQAFMHPTEAITMRIASFG